MQILTRARKRDKDNNRVNAGNIQDQNISTNLAKESNGEDVEDQKSENEKERENTKRIATTRS